MEGGEEQRPPDDLPQCKRTDGRDWRCKRPVADPTKSYCDKHLYRGQKKEKKPKNEKPPEKPKPRVKIRVLRVKPEPVDDFDFPPVPEPVPVHTLITALPSPVPVPVPKPKPKPVSDTVGVPCPLPENLRCSRNDGRSWRCKKEVMVGQTLCEAHFVKAQTQAQKRPRVRAQKEERENNVRVVEVPENLRCGRNNGKDWRCKRKAMEGFSLCKMHLNKLKQSIRDNKIIKEREKEKEKEKSLLEKSEIPTETVAIRGAGDNVVEETERENSEPELKKKRTEVEVEVVVPEGVRCAKTDGREWRCKRRVIEGENLCEVHLKRVVNKGKSSINKPKPEPKPKPKLEGKVGNGVEGEGEGDGDGDMRCKRTDGRGWRCKRGVLEGRTLCEIHFEQGRLRNMKVTVPESLKIQRGSSGGGERLEKRLKRKRALEALENSSDNKGMKKMKAELIRVFLRREIIERSKKGENESGNGGEEVTRDLPYGLMAIPPAPPTQFLDNAAGSLGIKVGVNCVKSTVNRRFRSKNIEPPPVGPVKVVPYVGNLGKVKSNGRRKCHWCRGSENRTLVKCLSCKKRFFCSDCIKERCTDPQEVKQRCPVCCGSCDCKVCGTTRSKDVDIKEILKQQCKVSKFQHLQYLINYLLPVLVRINEEQSVEVEMEAKFKGQNLSEVDIRQADVGCRDCCCCNNCKSPILDFHRSCPNCSYNLCISCCREYSRDGSLGGVKSSSFQYHNRTKADLSGLKKCPEQIQTSSHAHSTDSIELGSSPPVLDSTACLLSCPPMELGGCDNSLLDLRCIFPLNWTKELEVSAQEMASERDFPRTTDDCIFCAHTSQEADKSNELREASRRKESEDNFLYCPSTSDDHDSLLPHFQKHWQKGQPIKIRNVLQGASNLSWNPLAMFCSYLEKGSSNCENVKDAVEGASCSDWYDVEISTKESFIGSSGEGYTHKQCETLKLKAKLSSGLSRRLFQGQYGEIIDSLPLREYTDPRSGLLNLAGRLPESFLDSKLGPQVCISCGSREEVARGELVTQLCYNSYDVVNILVHANDTICSTEQIDKIKKLIRRNNAKDKRGCTSQSPENEETRMHSEISVEAGEQDRLLEGIPLNQGVGGASSCSAATNGASGVNLGDDKSPAKAHCSDTDSDASMICSGTNESPEKSVDQMSHLDRLEGTSLSDNRHPLDPCGGQWDVFRRQDIPKLLEYIAKHVDEFSDYSLPKNVVHPIFDGSFYLDAIHKLRLKEEFGIEPWTFNQCLGEAVFIPAGCPYQIRNVKSCVNIALGFVSPENVSDCIKLMGEIRVLPNSHKAKQNKLEVEKMTICSIDEAIKEMYRLRSVENAAVLA